ncbi:hypothetical protein K8W59_06190 [Nocardioides rotundus]|uniref:hypothetical protein n=1 Tax=Nocardioides rotundus TaxID=1774216 RepID=UPI001CBBF9EA|nr:hypothetical protein [Nocardioides rotundus]UAL31071.1 hypothetical protein K8W59_06190 [Nocardioides rotundus]
MRFWGRRRAKAEAEEDLEGSRQLAEEDVTVLGEQLQRLDAELAGSDRADAAREHHQAALDGYEQATRAVGRLDSQEDVAALLDTLSEARYEIVCARAVAKGQEPPERRADCFFNPQHGPSVRDVVHTFPRLGTRKVAVCAQCEARLEGGEEPDTRLVRLTSRTVPYWGAGTAYLPYLQGHGLVPAPGARQQFGGGPLSVTPSSGGFFAAGGFSDDGNSGDAGDPGES